MSLLCLYHLTPLAVVLPACAVVLWCIGRNTNVIKININAKRNSRIAQMDEVVDRELPRFILIGCNNQGPLS